MAKHEISRVSLAVGEACAGRTVLEAQREAAARMYGPAFFDTAALIQVRLPLSAEQAESWVLDALEAKAWSPWISGPQIVAPHEGERPFGERYTSGEIVAAARRLATTFDTTRGRLLLVADLLRCCKEIRAERVQRHLEAARADASTVRALPATAERDVRRDRIAAQLALDIAMRRFVADDEVAVNAELNRRCAMTDEELDALALTAAARRVSKAPRTDSAGRVEETAEMLAAAEERRRVLQAQAEALAAQEGSQEP